MYELPEQVTVTMFKSKQGGLYKTQAEAINADTCYLRYQLIERLKSLLQSDYNLRKTVSIKNDPTEMANFILDFLSNDINEILPMVQAYSMVK